LPDLIAILFLLALIAAGFGYVSLTERI